MLISIYEAEFWVLTAAIIQGAMYQPLAWQRSSIASEPRIQLSMQNCGISTFLCPVGSFSSNHLT